MTGLPYERLLILARSQPALVAAVRGDGTSADVEAARAVGMSTHLHRSADELRAVLADLVPPGGTGVRPG